jgi:hypothetical protein
MPKIRPGLEYFGLDLDKKDLEVLRKYAFDDDRSVGSLIRIIVSEWISRNPKALKLKASIDTQEPQAKGKAAKKAGA